MTTIKIQAGEVGVILEFTVFRAGVIQDLTDTVNDEIQLFVTEQGAVQVPVVNAAAGRADYVTVGNEWPVGVYDYQVEVKYNDGTLLKSARGKLIVEAVVA